MPAKGNLLLIEDDLAISEAMTHVLQTENYHVSSARSSKDAISRFNEKQIDVVLLDLSLGDEEGWQVFHKLKELRADLPIIVTSARTDELANSFASRASGVLEKPFDVGILLGLLDQIAGVPLRPAAI
jgi:two-component system OmpR family response regulator